MTAPSTTIAAPDTGSYELDPARSLIEFGTRHMFGLAPVKGTFRVVAGRLDITEPLTASRLEVTATTASFDTGNAKRDEHVRSQDFLDDANYPLIAFRSTSLERRGDSWALHGVVTARGQDAPVVLGVVAVDQDRQGALVLRATGKVDRYAHGITKMKGMAGRYLKLTLSARATRT